MQEERLELGRIVSYFEQNNFPATRATLEAELSTNHVKPIVINQGRIEQLKLAFVESNVLDFWSQWDQIGLTNNELEFFLQVYFCFSNAAQSGEINEEIVKSGQAAFKTFIETRAENALPGKGRERVCPHFRRLVSVWRVITCVCDAREKTAWAHTHTHTSASML